MAFESPQHHPSTEPVAHLAVDISELGPRTRAVIERIRATRQPVVLTDRGRTLARLVPIGEGTSDDGPIWDVEAIGP